MRSSSEQLCTRSRQAEDPPYQVIGSMHCSNIPLPSIPTLTSDKTTHPPNDRVNPVAHVISPHSSHLLILRRHVLGSVHGLRLRNVHLVVLPSSQPSKDIVKRLANVIEVSQLKRFSSRTQPCRHRTPLTSFQTWAEHLAHHFPP